MPANGGIPVKLTLRRLRELDPGFIARQTANDYQSFREALYDDIVCAAKHLEANPQLLLGQGEDQLTYHLIGVLAGMSYSAKHDTMHGGHVDLLVEKNGFDWIAEAKVFNSATSLKDGFAQLTTRYGLTGDVRSRYGGLLAYHFRRDAAGSMDGWRRDVGALVLKTFRVTATNDCHRRGQLAFYSSHTDPSSGLPAEIWHLCIELHFNPQDRSALKRKNPT